MAKRRNFSTGFKAKVALAAIKTLQVKVGELINVSGLIVFDTKRTQKRELISLTTSSASTILDEDGN